MDIETAPAADKQRLEFEEVDQIAENMIHWSRRQADAFNQMPLTYVDCLLDHVGKAEYVAWEEIPDALGNLVPQLEPDVCLTLVGIYLDRGAAPARSQPSSQLASRSPGQAAEMRN